MSSPHVVFLVELRVYEGKDARKSAIQSFYRPDWVSDSKPEYNCAQVVLDDSLPRAYPGWMVTALLEPLRPELWGTVSVGDVLEAREGLRGVASATVVSIFRMRKGRDEVQDRPDPAPAAPPDEQQG